MRSSMTASATVTVAASAFSIVAGSMPRCTLRTTTCWPGASVGAEAGTELMRSGKQLGGQLGRVGGADARAGADVGERVTGLQRELDRGAGTLGLVRVRE